MSARRSTTPSVQLFPFLAVLVCVMGALILLLLVTTRRIRQQALNRAAAAELQHEFEAGLLTLPREVRPIETESEPPEFVVPPLVVPIEEPPLPPPVPIEEPPPDPVPLPPAGPTAAELRAEWEQIVAKLQAERQRLESQLQQVEATSVDETSGIQSLESRLQQLEQRRAELRQDVSDLHDDSSRQMRVRTEAQQELSRVESEIQRLRTEHAQAAGKYSIVPYDGQSGTNRRPIVIECTESGLVFAAEKIGLTPQQLNGFTPTHNPLLAGTEALITYWAARDLQQMRSGQSLGRPYVLLVVRPGGTTAYYVARRLLEGLDQQFGYELVSDDQQFAWPETDAAAVAACRVAVDAMIAQRDRLIAQTRTGRMPVATQLQFADQEGRFYLEEVERLRRGQNTVNVGGRQFERAPQPTPQSTPRVIDIPRGGYANGTTSGGRGTSYRLEPSATPQGTSSTPSNQFESAIAARQARNNQRGQAGAGRAGLPDDGSRLNGPETGGSEPGHSGASKAGSGWNSADRTDASGGFPAQGNPGAHEGTRDDSSAGGAPQGWGPQGRTTATPGQSGSNSGPRPLFGSSATGGPDMPQSQMRVLRSAGGSPAAGDADTEIRQWGVREPGSSIGLEREVLVRVAADEVQVESERPIKITSGITREDLQEQLAGKLDAHVRGWGRPPKSFYWSPTIRFQVLPGGNQYQERLSELTDHWGLRSHIDQVLE